MINGIIFDMDGVIFNTQKLIFESEILLFQKMNLKISKKKHESYAGNTSWELWKNLKKEFYLKEDIKHLVYQHRKFGFEYIKKHGIFPVNGVEKLLINLNTAGIKIALATSGWQTRADWMLKSTNLYDKFDFIAYGDDVKNSKPEPDIFLYAAKYLNISNTECCVIEDSKNGVIAANKANIIVLGFNNPDSGNQDLSTANYIFNDFTKLTIDTIKGVSGN